MVQTTNAQGDATSWKSYSAFGQIESSSDLGELPSYGYNAEEQHPTTGLTYLRFRYYEASTSTFGVQDTYLGNIFSPMTLNRYLYCLSNPVNYVDPTGHSVAPLIDLSFVANNIASLFNTIITEVVTDFYTKIGDKKNAAKYGRKLRKAQDYREKLLAFYCGNAGHMRGFVYDRDLAIRYARAFSEKNQGMDWNEEWQSGGWNWSLRNPNYPSYSSNCTNFISQVLEAGGFKQNDEWHSKRRIYLPLWIEAIPTEYNYLKWDTTAQWSSAKESFEYISDPKNGYTYKEIVNIYSSNGSASDQMINVAQSNISGAAGRLDIQKGDVVYFYTHDKGVEHAGIVSSVENGQIKYSGNSKRRFDHPSEDGMKGYDGVYIVRIGD